jgi:regulatory LuxR family protein
MAKLASPWAVILTRTLVPIGSGVAGVLGISEHTIKAHRARVMQKTGVVYVVVELVRLAVKARVAPPQPEAALVCE